MDADLFSRPSLLFSCRSWFLIMSFPCWSNSVTSHSCWRLSLDGLAEGPQQELELFDDVLTDARHGDGLDQDSDDLGQQFVQLGTCDGVGATVGELLGNLSLEGPRRRPPVSLLLRRTLEVLQVGEGRLTLGLAKGLGELGIAPGRVLDGLDGAAHILGSESPACAHAHNGKNVILLGSVELGASSSGHAVFLGTNRGGWIHRSRLRPPHPEAVPRYSNETTARPMELR